MRCSQKSSRMMGTHLPLFLILILKLRWHNLKIYLLHLVSSLNIQPCFSYTTHTDLAGVLGAQANWRFDFPVLSVTGGIFQSTKACQHLTSPCLAALQVAKHPFSLNTLKVLQKFKTVKIFYTELLCALTRSYHACNTSSFQTEQPSQHLTANHSETSM